MNPASDPRSDADRASYDLLTRACAQVAAPDLAALAFRGDDAVDWLQGQVSNDLIELEVGKTLEACFLDATGHVQAPALLGRLADRVVAVVPVETVPGLMDRVERSVFMEDVALEPVAGPAVALFGPKSDEVLASMGHDGESPAVALPNGRIALGRPVSGQGWVLVGRRVEAVPFANLAAAEALRLELGMPVWGRDIGPKTLLPEMGPAFTGRNVSYTKGCYLGQEVVMRIRSRGHTNRTWVGLLCERPVAAGVLVHSEARANAGTVTSAATSPKIGPIAAAMLANAAAEPGARVTVDSEDGQVVATVAPFPLRESF